jgi:hypothetical protein
MYHAEKAVKCCSSGERKIVLVTRMAMVGRITFMMLGILSTLLAVVCLPVSSFLVAIESSSAVVESKDAERA